MRIPSIHIVDIAAMSDVSDPPIVRITVTRNVTLALLRIDSNVTLALISDEATSPLCLRPQFRPWWVP
jgi:hypothetical protein